MVNLGRGEAQGRLYMTSFGGGGTQGRLYIDVHGVGAAAAQGETPFMTNFGGGAAQGEHCQAYNCIHITYMTNLGQH